MRGSSERSDYRSGSAACACYCLLDETTPTTGGVTLATGQPAGRVERLPGGAGNRTTGACKPQGETAVGDGASPEPSEERGSEQGSRGPRSCLQSNVRRYLDRIGVRVPRLLLDASADGISSSRI